MTACHVSHFRFRPTCSAFFIHLRGLFSTPLVHPFSDVSPGLAPRALFDPKNGFAPSLFLGAGGVDGRHGPVRVHVMVRTDSEFVAEATADARRLGFHDPERAAARLLAEGVAPCQLPRAVAVWRLAGFSSAVGEALASLQGVAQ